jgi:nucleoside-diphosphate-sugar epimerase
MSRIAVTGATGFVGRVLVEALLDQGDEVRALVRPGSVGSLALRADSVRGDIRSPDAIRSLLDGCEAVVHLASTFSPDDDVEEIVVGGTRNLVRAATELGVGRLVFAGCLGSQASSPSALMRAKWQAEIAVRSSGLEYVVLKPSVILGPGDGVTRPMADLMRRFPVVPVPGRGEQRVQPVDVQDVVRCIVRSLASSEFAGQEISVGGSTFMTFRELADVVGSVAGVARPKALVPVRLLPLVTRLLPSGVRELFAPSRLGLFEYGVVASPGIIQRVFGFTPTPVIPRLHAYLAAAPTR